MLFHRFNPTNELHRAIILNAIENADTWGSGRISEAREALAENNITTKGVENSFDECVFELGIYKRL